MRAMPGRTPRSPARHSAAVQQCEEAWRSGKELCSAVSLSGRPCTVAPEEHRAEEGGRGPEEGSPRGEAGHSSGLVYLLADAAGLSRQGPVLKRAGAAHHQRQLRPMRSQGKPTYDMSLESIPERSNYGSHCRQQFPDAFSLASANARSWEADAAGGTRSLPLHVTSAGPKGSRSGSNALKRAGNWAFLTVHDSQRVRRASNFAVRSFHFSSTVPPCAQCMKSSKSAHSTIVIYKARLQGEINCTCFLDFEQVGQTPAYWKSFSLMLSECCY